MMIDPLTGVYSRQTLEQRLHEEVERAQRYGSPFSMLLVDLDHYKSVNDAFGHARGDTVLKEFARRLVDLLRKADIIFRYGGDEFLLLLPNTNKIQSVLLARRLLDGISSQPFQGQPPLTLTISLGVASFPDDAPTAEALFDKADQRHYEAKRLGRCRFVAEDTEKPHELQIDEDARLVERDAALEALHHFLKELPEKKRGLFAITGPPASGQSRFLAEAGKVARLQGYEVIAFQGSPALKNRVYGGLTEAGRNWPDLPAPAAGKDEFSQGLAHIVREKGRTGIFFTIDRLAETDWSTQELMRCLLQSSQPGIIIGLAFSTDTPASRLIFPQTPPLYESVELGPLSPAGFNIWLRQLLKWEAPQAFTDWLYQQTGGLSTLLKRAVILLVKQGLLQKDGRGWVITREFSDLSIQSQLMHPALQPPHNLPGASTYFIGREREIGEVKDLLGRDRLVTLLGPGGMGKTRLALQVAAEMLDQFPDGVFWVPLAGVETPEYLVSSIANALGLTFFSREEAQVQLDHFLREKQLLIVLDNFEQLTAAAGLVAAGLERSPMVKALVTSRERLNLRGEVVLEMQGMAYPAAADTDEAESYTAVQLFVQTARHAQPDFSLTPENKPAVARICRLVDGLPLGIELASAWVRLLTCEEIAQEIEQNLDFLTTPLRDVPERHRSLRAVFEHSWNLLNPPEKDVLSQISVFERGFTREAASHVAGASLVHLSTLMEKSLLRRSPSGRFEMHEVLRQYAQEKLKQVPGSEPLVRSRHSQYYLTFLAQQKSRLSSSRIQSLEAIAGEMDNIRAAWIWELDGGKIERIEAALDSLFTYYEVRSLFMEGEQVFTRTLDILKDCPADHSDYRRLVARLNIYRAAFYNRLSRFDRVPALLAENLAISRELDDSEFTALALSEFGKYQMNFGQFDLARRSVLDGLEIRRELGDVQGLIAGLDDLGAIAYQQGEYQKAEQYLQEALQLCRETNDKLLLANTLINLGNIETELGDYSQAVELYQESRMLYEETGAKVGLANALNNLGDISKEIGAYNKASQYLRQSCDIYTQIGNPYGLAIALSNLGGVAYRQGNYEEARQYVEHSLSIRQKMENPLEVAYSLAQLGYVACALDQETEAEKYLHSALDIAAQNQTLPLVMEVVIGIAILFNRKGNLERALELLVFALNHPATLKYQREEAEDLRMYIESQLSHETVQQAAAKGLILPVDEVVRQILAPAPRLTEEQT